jgi:nucleoside-diphosphate-sugar epimerase
MRVAVTGASGQLGAQLLRRLLADPSITGVVSIDRAPAVVLDRRVTHHQRDIRDPGLDALFAGCEAVFHLAFVVLQHLPRPEFDAINVGGSKNVFEAAARAKVPYVLYTSSVASYGVLPGHPEPIDEQTTRRYQADFPYAATKYEVEAFLDTFEPAHPEMTITRLRPAIIVGPEGTGPTDDQLRHHLWVMSSEHGMPLVWQEDVVQAALLAFRKRARGAFVLAADGAMPGNQLAAAAGWHCLRVPPRLRLALGRGLRRVGKYRQVRIDPSWLIYLDVRLRFRSQKARDELGWQPECPTCVDILKRYAALVPSQATPAQEVLYLAFDALSGLSVR